MSVARKIRRLLRAGEGEAMVAAQCLVSLQVVRREAAALAVVPEQPRESGAPERLVAHAAPAVSSSTAAGAEGLPPAPDSAPAGFVGGSVVRAGVERGAPVTWTPERVAMVRGMAAEGLSDGQIGALFGRAASAINSVRNRFDIPAGRGTGQRVTSSPRGGPGDAVVVALWATETSNAEIAERSGLGLRGVSRVARRLGLPKRVGGRKADPSKTPAVPKVAKTKAKAEAKAKAKAKAKRKAAPKLKAPKVRVVEVKDPVVVPAVPLPPHRRPAVVAPVRPPAGAAPMIALGPGDCRWPVGQDALGRHLFCGGGAVEGRPYCAEHHARSVKPRTESPS